MVPGPGNQRSTLDILERTRPGFRGEQVLPDEVLFDVLAFVSSGTDFLQLESTCRQFWHALRDDERSQSLWRARPIYYGPREFSRTAGVVCSYYGTKAQVIREGGRTVVLEYACIAAIQRQQFADDNLFLKWLGGADGFRKILTYVHKETGSHTYSNFPGDNQSRRYIFTSRFAKTASDVVMAETLDLLASAVHCAAHRATMLGASYRDERENSDLAEMFPCAAMLFPEDFQLAMHLSRDCTLETGPPFVHIMNRISYRFFGPNHSFTTSRYEGYSKLDLPGISQAAKDGLVRDLVRRAGGMAYSPQAVDFLWCVILTRLSHTLERVVIVAMHRHLRMEDDSDDDVYSMSETEDEGDREPVVSTSAVTSAMCNSPKDVEVPVLTAKLADLKYVTESFPASRGQACYTGCFDDSSESDDSCDEDRPPIIHRMETVAAAAEEGQQQPLGSVLGANLSDGMTANEMIAFFSH